MRLGPWKRLKTLSLTSRQKTKCQCWALIGWYRLSVLRIGACYGRSNHAQQLIVNIRGHPAKITISTGVATSEWAQKCNMRPMLWSLLQPTPNPARRRPSSFSSHNRRYHDLWYSTNQWPHWHKLNRRHQRSPFCDQAANDYDVPYCLL